MDLQEEINHRVLKIIEQEPEISQRDLADRLGVSLGKTNFLMKGLLEKGYIKARNFKNSRNKRAYAYFLTPVGLEEKARLTVRYVQRKMREYEALKSEIETLKEEHKDLLEQAEAEA